MKIKIVTDAGNVETIQATVIEPAIMTPGNIILDKGERDDGRTLVSLADIICITD